MGLVRIAVAVFVGAVVVSYLAAHQDIAPKYEWAGSSRASE